MVDEVRDLENDPLFQEASRKIKKGNYLGDLEVLNQLLRFYITNLVDQLQRTENRKWKMAEVRRQASSLSRILLGKSREFQSVSRWNEPGGIDEFCRRWLGVDDDTPDDRMEHAVLVFFDEILEIAGYASTDGVLEEQWGWQLDATIEKYAAMFVGVSPAQMMAMEISSE